MKANKPSKYQINPASKPTFKRLYIFTKGKHLFWSPLKDQWLPSHNNVQFDPVCNITATQARKQFPKAFKKPLPK